MTNQIKAGASRCGLWQANPTGRFRLFSFLRIVVLAVIIFCVQSRSYAQGNLVDLYNWSNETEVGYDPNPNDYVNIVSATSAYFYGDYSPNGFAVPILSTTLNTIPGATYDVSFTLQDQNVEACSGYEYFGNTSTDVDLQPPVGDPINPSLVPENIDFTVIANSTETDMSFEFALDSSGIASLSNFSVTEVPEVSSGKLFVFLGCILLCVRKWRRLLQMRTCNAVVRR